MGEKRIRQIVSRLVRALAHQQIKTDKVVLFGSYAQGRYYKDSDLDLLFISSGFAGQSFHKRAKILGDAHREVPDCPMDLVAVTPQEWDRGDSPIINYAKNGKSLVFPS